MPTIKLTDQELQEHRKSATENSPSLPHRAGRAYGKLKRGEWSKVNYAVMPDGRAIGIRTIVRPQPDVKMLAKVFLDIAKREAGL